MLQGIVQSVNTASAGGYPLALTPAGETELLFEDAADFDEEGGELRIGEAILPYVSVDLETDILTLAEALPFQVDEHDFVETVPHVEETLATVVLGDDVVQARVPHALKALLPDGEREDTLGETVYIRVDSQGSPEVQDLVGNRPAYDGMFIENADEMLLENERMLGEVLGENAAAIVTAQGEISEAQQRINDAFSELDLKPDQDYVDAAKQQAIDAAAIEATRLADAAERDSNIYADNVMVFIGDQAVQYTDQKIATAEQELQAAIASGDADAIAAAEAKIAVAKQEAIDAAASDATAKAAEAMNKATAALTAAEAAQATADNAIRTYYSTTPPWADGSTQPEDVLGDMWFDDASGQAYRWNGTSWQVIQDGAIADALAAAQSAQTTADGKITAFYQPNEPLEGEEGDLWFDTDNGNRVHRRTADAWVDLADERIADQGEAIATLTTRTDGMTQTYWSTALPGTTQAPKGSVWYQTDVDGINAKIISVFVQESATTLRTWQARPITSEAIDNLDVGKLTAASGVVNDLVANAFAAKLANIIQANIGNLTVTGDTHLNSLVAQAIAGDTASFLKLTVSQILAGDIQAQWIITEDGAIVAGNPTGARVEITNDGIRVFVLGFNGQPYEAVSMVNGELSFGVIGQDGTRIAGISSSGNITGQSGSFSKDPFIKGIPFLGQMGGGAAQGWMDRAPRGLVKSNASTTTTSYYSVERPYVRLAVRLYPNRTYRVIGNLTGQLDVNNGVLRGNVRYVLGSGTADVTSPEVWGPATSAPVYSSTVNLDVSTEGFFWVEAETRVSMVLTYRGINGAKARAYQGRLYVEDMGPRSIADSGGEDAEPKMEYTTTWAATASRAYDINGARITSKENKIALWYWGATGALAADNAAVLFGGNSFESVDGSNSGIDLNVTLNQALTGATIYKAEIYLHNADFLGYPDGSTALNTLGSGSLPTTKTVDGTVLVSDIAEGTGVWIDVPVSWFTNGTNKGVTIGDKDRSVTINGKTTIMSPANFHGPNDSEPPLLRLTYAK